MFSDKNANEFPEIGFQSSWKKSKSVASSSCQTHPVEQAENETQSTYLEEMGTQTIQPSSKYGNDSDEKDSYLKDPKFYKFLNKTSKLLDTEIERVLRSRAFIGVQQFDDSEDEKAIRKLHMLDATSSTINAKENKRNEGAAQQVELYKCHFCNILTFLTNTIKTMNTKHHILTVQYGWGNILA